MKNLVGEIFTGWCPECLETPEMKDNTSDFWECPLCGLQIRTLFVVVILHDKGKGDFKNPTIYAPDHLSVTSDKRIKKDYRFMPQPAWDFIK